MLRRWIAAGIRWRDRLNDNWRVLRAATDEIGAEVEQWPYAQLQQPAEEQFLLERVVEGQPCSWQVETFDIQANGDLHICIDCRSQRPTWFGIKPSYAFIKQPDGNVSY